MLLSSKKNTSQQNLSLFYFDEYPQNWHSTEKAKEVKTS